MRTTITIASLAVGLLGCQPEIVPGAYLCGPEQACPEDQVCNGPDNMCVLASGAEPFACGPSTETEPNNTLATAQPLGTFACVSPPFELAGCAKDGDTEDDYAFDAAPGCTAVAVQARIVFPVAFEQLTLELRGDGGAVLATGTPCTSGGVGDGSDQLCISQPIAAGGHYSVRVARTGQGTCDGMCAFNRYQLHLQLATP